MWKFKLGSYKTWSFRLLIYLIVINVASFFIVVRHNSLFDGFDKLHQAGQRLGVIANVIFLLGAVCTVLSIVKKEKRNYQYYTSIIVYPIVLLLFVVNLM